MKPHANQRQTASYPLCWSTQHTPKRRHGFCIAGTIVNQAARRRYRGARQLQITVIQPVYPPCIGGPDGRRLQYQFTSRVSCVMSLSR
jgi:hypothetical protein